MIEVKHLVLWVKRILSYQNIKKTFLLFLIFFLFDSIVYAKSGVGELKLSEQTLRHFHKHITSKKGKPYIFLVTEDGQGSSSWYCPYAQCAPTGASNERGKCEKRYGKKCFVFALGYSVKWKNNFTKEAKGKEKKFRSKDSLEDMRYKLKALGFLEGNTVSQKTNENKTEKVESKDFVKRLEKLADLYKSGQLTEKQFNDAKNKILKEQ